MLREFLIATFVAQSFTNLAMAHDPANSSPYDPKVEDLTTREPPTNSGEPPMLGVHWSRDFAGGRLHREKKQQRKHDLSRRQDHGERHLDGHLLGPNRTNSSFVGDKIAGLDSWYPFSFGASEQRAGATRV